MDHVIGKALGGSLKPADKSSYWQTNQQSIHPFNRNHQRQLANRFSQDEESVQSSNRKAIKKPQAVKDHSLRQEQDAREDRHDFDGESDYHPSRVSVDPLFTQNVSHVSPVSSPTNTGASKHQGWDEHQSATLTHESMAPTSPRSFESRAARVARLKHVRPKAAQVINGAVNPDGEDGSDALSQCSFDINKRLENSPLHKMMQQKRSQKTISVSPPRSREITPARGEKPERISEKLKRIARSQSPAPRRTDISEACDPEARSDATTGNNQTAHPVFGYTKNTLKPERNYKSEEAFSKQSSPPRAQFSGHATATHSYSNHRSTHSPPLGHNAASSAYPERNGITKEKNSNSYYDDKRNIDTSHLAGRSQEHHSPNITTRRKKGHGTDQDQEYRMAALPRDTHIPQSNTRPSPGESEHLDPTLIEVAMSDESTISTISHKFSADAERRDVSGYQTADGLQGRSRPQQQQVSSSNEKRFDTSPTRSEAVYKWQKARQQNNGEEIRYQDIENRDGSQNRIYKTGRTEPKGDNTTGRADDDIFDGLEDDTLQNDTIFRFADDDGYIQKEPMANVNPTTKVGTRAHSTSFSKVGRYGRSGMVVEGARANKSVISDITSDLKSKINREYRRKDYSGAEVATIEENTACDAESYVDGTDIGGSRTVDDTLGYTVEEQTEYQDSYEDESVIGVNTQECAKELILDSAFYKMGCAVVSSLTSALSSQDVINQLCQDPRSCSQLKRERKGNCNFIRGFGGVNRRTQDKTLQQVVQELADSSDYSDTDPATKRTRQDEERKQAQSKLLDYANQAMGHPSTTRRRQPQVLGPIVSQTSHCGQGGTGSAYSISAADDIGSSDNSSALSVVQTKALTEVSASLRNEGVKALKLNRHKKWQVRYLKVSQDDSTKCPKALLWLKNPSASMTKLPDLRTNGQGGFLFFKLRSVEAVQNTSLLDNLPKNLRRDFPLLQVVALDYDCDEGPRQVIISFKNSAEAEAFSSAVKVIKLWAEREGSTAHDPAQK